MSNSKEIEIVFVQLGEKLPAHLISNLILVNQLFPSISINLLTSPVNKFNSKVPGFVSISTFQPDLKLDLLLKNKSRNLAFRNGFWRYSLERLFAIADFHLTRPEKSLLHIESDVLLLNGFPLGNFSSLEKIAWMTVDAKKDIASLMYFPNAELSQEFSRDLFNFVSSDTSPTDMTALNSLRRNNSHKYTLLPTWSHESEELHTNLSADGESNSMFGHGIFDAAGIGMWLTGIDPRNNYGITKYFASHLFEEGAFYVNPSAFMLEVSQNGKIFYKTENSDLQVFNLHVHSKSSRVFSQDCIKEITRLALLSNKLVPYQEFSLRIFLGLISSNLREGTLLAFLFYSPPFKILRIFLGYWRKKTHTL